MPFRSILILILTLLLMITLYLISFLNAGKWLVRDDKPERGDAIVLLTGSIADRVLETADAYHRGVAPRVIIVEESMGAYKSLEERGIYIISNTEQISNSLVKLGVPQEKISILPGDARSTKEEAMIISRFLTANNAIDTLILITSKPHSRRATMIFRHIFKESDPLVTLLSRPSMYTDFNSADWWKSREDIQDVLFEYVKLASFVLFERRK